MKKVAFLLVLIMTSPVWAGKRSYHTGACLPREVGTMVTMCDPSTQQTECLKNRLVDAFMNNGWTLGACPVIADCNVGNTLACCQYGAAGVTNVVTCSDCPATLGGVNLAGCQCDAYASGDGSVCIPVGQ